MNLGELTWGGTHCLGNCYCLGLCFFQDWLFGAILFKHKPQTGSPYFQGWLCGPSVLNCCSGMGWHCFSGLMSNCVVYPSLWIFFNSYYLLLFISSFAVLLNCFYPKPRGLYFVSWFFSPPDQVKEQWASIHVFVVADWGQTMTNTYIKLSKYLLEQ